MPLVACVQMNGSSDSARNLAQVDALVRRAAAAGATLVLTPEATDWLGPHDEKVARAEPLGGPFCAAMSALARELGITLLIGSLAERGPAGPGGAPPTHAGNTSVLVGPDGARTAAYRKIHLFDVDLAARGGVSFRESDRTLPGDALVVADSPVGPLGLSVCFDLRFPEVYAGLVARGARALTVPSAFTLMTGKDHWHALLRARAIETQCFVFAPAQWGPHDDRGLRRSYGHSLIVDPWGTVLAECGDGPGLALAWVDPAVVDEVRAQIPVGAARRLC